MSERTCQNCGYPMTLVSRNTYAKTKDGIFVSDEADETIEEWHCERCDNREYLHYRNL